MTLTVGFIGLGTMGLPMARHIINRGFKLKLYARRAEVFEGKAKELIDLGATPCLKLSEVATDVDIVITNVTGTNDVESVLTGPEGAIHSASPGTLFIDHSTIDPARTMEVAKQLRAAGMEFVDAPVSGGVWASEEARLIVMQGGHPDACARANQIIDCYAKAITRVGDAGHGQIAKLSNQIAQTITIEGVAECLTFAKNLGADPQAVFEAIKDGMGGSQMMSLMAPKMIAEDFDAGIEARLHAKDVGIALETANARQLPLPCLEFVGSQYQTIMDQDLGTRDSSILFDMLKRLRER
ncbi:MAG: NAD(P)-dependent oxidoreductase [Gammaproteobacteria bacterium]|jgi:3-hydroxyisobutyrate dehydrogenase-like beta-hydroxyacid dehydrogenase